MKHLKKDLQAVTREHKKLAQKILLWQYFMMKKDEVYGWATFLPKSDAYLAVDYTKWGKMG